MVSGFSGVGKGTVVKELREKHPTYALSISMTTREPRSNEQNGVQYFFVTKEEFEKTIAEDGLIEYARYLDNYYGTPRKYVEDCLADGQDVILEIEIQGAMKVKDMFPEAMLIFMMPPSAQVLKSRLCGRGTEDDDVIAMRMHRATEEAVGIENYDYIVVNDQLEDCVEELHKLVLAAHDPSDDNMVFAAQRKAVNNMEFITQVRSELNTLVKGE